MAEWFVSLSSKTRDSWHHGRKFTPRYPPQMLRCPETYPMLGDFTYPSVTVTAFLTQSTFQAIKLARGILTIKVHEKLVYGNNSEI